MAGGAAAGMGVNRKLLAMFGDGSIIVQDHHIPADKELSKSWIDALTSRGKKEVWSGEELSSIGMPVGGIAAGQIYLKGDGTLGVWEIFNRHEFFGYGLTSYDKRPVPRTVACGFNVSVNGLRKTLGQEDFPDVTFEGTYPTATNTYRFTGQGVTVIQKAYSPFIPLNAKDSALPATIFEIEIRNDGDAAVRVQLEGFLENAVALSAAKDPQGRKRRSHSFSGSRLGFVHTADRAEDELSNPVSSPRPAITIADFEGSTYGDWTVEGDAFGTGPAKGTLPNQQNVSGHEGRGLVNSFLNGDEGKGRLLSPEFTLSRRFINFKIGGGNHPGLACINLLVDGRPVRTATGLNDEKLLWETWDVREFAGRAAAIEIRDDVAGAWGHINIDHIEQADVVRSMEDVRTRRGDRNRDHGTLALSMIDADGRIEIESSYGFDKPHLGRIEAKEIGLGAGKSAHYRVVLTWHFPNHVHGRQYANWFKDAEDVAAYIADNFETLSHDTQLWVDTYYDSTLPYWLLDRIASTNSNLATGTTEWWGDGRFWAWEGVVCCEGTCTHVWNYEHGMARLFPDLERNVRHRQDFGAGFEESTGLVGFRGNRAYAADGQCGTVLKAYREHLTSADNAFLVEHWPMIKRALLYTIGHDANADGILEDRQHNTFDIDFYGANTFIGSLYLGALRAGEEMAKELGESDFAAMCRQIFEKGRDKSVAELWNGEYFIQVVDEKAHKEYQYGPGCLSDQLFGQGWAHQVALGELYPAEKVRTALKSIWTYNYSPSVGTYNAVWKPERPFAVDKEAGLFICTWPKGGRQGEPVRYRDEVWTGIEYQVAGHMIWEGMTVEGLSICRAIHERYHPIKRNPYNEVECSDHYARALASWGVLTALSGFQHHGPKGIIGFAPKLSGGTFKSAFTAAEGWGTFKVSADECLLSVHWGSVRVNEIRLGTEHKSATVYYDGAVIESTSSRDGANLVIRFKEEQVLESNMWVIKLI